MILATSKHITVAEYLEREAQPECKSEIATSYLSVKNL
jgi:hypothetical protein